MLRGVQDFVATQQGIEDLERKRACAACGQRRRSKEIGTYTVKTVFGPVEVPNPRWNRCVCQSEGPRTFRPAAAWLQGERSSPELLYLETKWASLIPFEKVADLLKEVLPVGETTNHETVREHLQAGRPTCRGRVGRRTGTPRFCDAGCSRRTAASRRSHDGRPRWRIRACGPQARLFRGDRRQKCRGVPEGGRRPSAAGEMLRLRADLRSEAAAAALGGHAVSRHARKSAARVLA